MTLYVITGPPAAGKTTWMRQHAKPGDITIDFDAIAATLTPDYDHKPPRHIINIAAAARQAAIDRATPLATSTDVYIIHAIPNPQQLRRYHALGAHIITIDPGRQTCLQRAQTERPDRATRLIEQWYANPTAKYAAAVGKYTHADW